MNAVEKVGHIETFIYSLLTIVFLTLKLTDVINWDWVWVLAPLWINQGFLFILHWLCCIFNFIFER